jgi:hypothetical protein
MARVGHHSPRSDHKYDQTTQVPPRIRSGLRCCRYQSLRTKRSHLAMPKIPVLVTLRINQGGTVKRYRKAFELTTVPRRRELFKISAIKDCYPGIEHVVHIPEDDHVHIILNELIYGNDLAPLLDDGWYSAKTTFGPD